MCNDTEEWWKIWKGTDLLFQNWHKEFDIFRLENLKVSKIGTLMGCFRPKYIMLELKRYRGVIFHDTRVDAKFEENLTCGLENDMKNLANLHHSTRKPQIGTFIGSFHT